MLCAVDAAAARPIHSARAGGFCAVCLLFEARAHALGRWKLCVTCDITILVLVVVLEYNIGGGLEAVEDVLLDACTNGNVLSSTSTRTNEPVTGSCEGRAMGSIYG